LGCSAFYFLETQGLSKMPLWHGFCEYVVFKVCAYLVFKK